MTTDGTNGLIVEGDLTTNGADEIHYSFHFRSTEVCVKFVHTDGRQWYGASQTKHWQKGVSFVWGLAIRQYVTERNYQYEQHDCSYVVDHLEWREGRVQVEFGTTLADLVRFKGRIDSQAVRDAVAHHGYGSVLDG